MEGADQVLEDTWPVDANERQPDSESLRSVTERLEHAVDRLRVSVEARIANEEAPGLSASEAEELQIRCAKLEKENEALRRALEKSDENRRSLESKNEAALGRLDSVINQLRDALAAQ